MRFLAFFLTFFHITANAQHYDSKKAMEAWCSIKPVEYFLEEVEIVNPMLQQLVDSIYLKHYSNRKAVFQELFFLGMDTLEPNEERYGLSENSVSLSFRGWFVTDSMILYLEDKFFIGLVCIKDDYVLLRCNRSLFDNFFKNKNSQKGVFVMPSAQVFEKLTFHGFFDFILFEWSMPSIEFLFDGQRYLDILQLGD
jgi:hypothetical protein